jgi:chitin disaccharide deacetylase
VRSIVVCADDAGWSEVNDAVIRTHAGEQQISAVSLLIDGPTAAQWSSHALSASCGLGLHFNLTWSPATGSRELGRLVGSAFSGLLDSRSIDGEIARQLGRFERLIGRPPDFIDGHQHVHVLPLIRDRLMHYIENRYSVNDRPLIRVPYSARWRGFKAAALNMLGAAKMTSQLRGRQWLVNPDFAGVYDFSTHIPYRTLMRRWLDGMPSGGVIMCHPGTYSLPEHGAARRMESDYLASDEWTSDRLGARVLMVPFTRSSLSPILMDASIG